MLLGFACPTPSRECGGSQIISVNHGSNSAARKYHGDTKQVLRCYGKYLQSVGFVMLSTRTFASPNGGPIRVLDRRPGTPVYTGKGAKDGGRGRSTILKKHKRMAF